MTRGMTPSTTAETAAVVAAYGAGGFADGGDGFADGSDGFADGGDSFADGGDGFADGGVGFPDEESKDPMSDTCNGEFFANFSAFISSLSRQIRAEILSPPRSSDVPGLKQYETVRIKNISIGITSHQEFRCTFLELVGSLF